MVASRLALENGGDDGLGAETTDVTEDVVQVEVHFGEDFLHQLHLLAGLGHHCVSSRPKPGRVCNAKP